MYQTQIFAAITAAELIPIFTLFAGMLVAFYGFSKFILSQAEKASIADREERKEMVKAFNRVADATERSAREAKERNGHLGEQNVQIAKLISSQIIDIREIRCSSHRTADILSKSALIAAEDRELLLAPTEQHIGTQVVEEQIIQSRE